MAQKIRKTFGVLLMVGALVCFVLAFLQLREYEEGNEEYDQLIEENISDPTPDEEGEAVSEAPANPEEEDDFWVNWDSLYEQNPDLVGWIRMGSAVNYPVVQGENNSYYLKRGFNRSYNINGAIFMNADNKSDWSDKHTIVYGHNMRNGSMFGSNKRWQDKSYALSHPCFYIYTPDGRYTYRIFDTITATDATAPFNINLGTQEAFAEYLKQMNQIKNYGLDVKVGTDDQIVTLSTCTSRGSRRFLIQGVLESFRTYDGQTITVEELRQIQATITPEETPVETIEETPAEAVS